MKTLINITAALVISFGSFTLTAQQNPMFTHYMYNTLIVNPAYAGSREALTVTGLHRSQWTAFKGAPRTQTLTMHTPLGNEHIGVGLSLMNDRLGPTNNTSVNAQFAYRMKLNQKSKLSLGLSGGVDIYQADLNSLNTDQTGDPVFENNLSNRTAPNFGFGAYYSRERFYAGVSVPNLIENNYAETSPSGNLFVGEQQRHYYFIAGALFDLTHGLALKPTALIKATAAAPMQADFTGTFIFHERFHVGGMYRVGDAYGALVGVTFNQVYLGYSFDKSYGLNTFRYNQGSHEIILRYDFIFANKKQIRTPRHF